MTVEHKDSTSQAPLRHPAAFEPLTLITTVLLSVVGAFIGIRLITT